MQHVGIAVVLDFLEGNRPKPRGSRGEAGFIGKRDDFVVIVIVSILSVIEPFQTAPDRVLLAFFRSGPGGELNVGGAEVRVFEPDMDSEGNAANSGLECRRQGQRHFNERADSGFRLKRGGRNFDWHRLGTIVERPTIDRVDARAANIVEWLAGNDGDRCRNTAPILVEEVEFVVGMPLGRAFQMPDEWGLRDDDGQAILSEHIFREKLGSAAQLGEAMRQLLGKWFDFQGVDCPIRVLENGKDADAAGIEERGIVVSVAQVGLALAKGFDFGWGEFRLASAAGEDHGAVRRKLEFQLHAFWAGCGCVLPLGQFVFPCGDFAVAGDFFREFLDESRIDCGGDRRRKWAVFLSCEDGEKGEEVPSVARRKGFRVDFKGRVEIPASLGSKGLQEGVLVDRVISGLAPPLGSFQKRSGWSGQGEVDLFRNQIGEGWLGGWGFLRLFNNGSLVDQKFRNRHRVFAMTAVGAGAIANESPGLEGEVDRVTFLLVGTQNDSLKHFFMSS
jgi:hypothetical protein